MTKFLVLNFHAKHQIFNGLNTRLLGAAKKITEVLLYRNPDILILDEATSSLDAINENIIVNNINDFRKNKTIIIAAHRLSTVKRADKILMMDNGEIIESGTHNELLERKQAYYNLVSHQLENPEYRY